jgi:hypothetical protein
VVAAGGDAELFAYLGAESSRGHSARREAAIAGRNRSLRAAAQRWTDLPVTEAARLLHGELVRYAERSWPREQHQANNPRPVGSLRHHLFAALRASGRPIGEAQLRRVLGRKCD